MYPPDISIREGRRKRRKPLISPPKSVESYRSTAGYNESVVDGPGNAEYFNDLSNRGDVNENGKTDDMNWATMGKEEMQYQQNDADKLDISTIDILLCYWKSSNGRYDADNWVGWTS